MIQFNHIIVEVFPKVFLETRIEGDSHRRVAAQFCTTRGGELPARWVQAAMKANEDRLQSWTP